MLMVEGRKQLPNESGSDYALTKRTMIVRRATPVTNQEMVRALIRGLNNSDHRAAMLNNEPANLTEFIAEINRLEGITKPLLSVDEFSALLPLMGSTPLPPPAPTPQSEPEQHTIQSIGTALKEMCDWMQLRLGRRERLHLQQHSAPIGRGRDLNLSKEQEGQKLVSHRLQIVAQALFLNKLRYLQVCKRRYQLRQGQRIRSQRTRKLRIGRVTVVI